MELYKQVLCECAVVENGPKGACSGDQGDLSLKHSGDQVAWRCRRIFIALVFAELTYSIASECTGAFSQLRLQRFLNTSVKVLIDEGKCNFRGAETST